MQAQLKLIDKHDDDEMSVQYTKPSTPFEEQSRVFINALYGNKPPKYHILTWTLPDKDSYWFTDHKKASEFVSGKKNFFTGVGLSPNNFGQKARCKSNQIIGIPGHFIDIDVKDVVHSKNEHLFETYEDALACIDKFPLKPTIIIDSGHGVQAWWLFWDILLFDDDKARETAQEQARRFNYTFKKLAEPYEVDSTYDFARVLRIPGTINAKREPFKEVKILHFDDMCRYNPQDFEEHILSTDQLPAKAARKSTGGAFGSAKADEYNFVLDATAEPPAVLLDTLIDVNPKFKQTWQRERTDLPSDSEYDFTLILFAKHAGWEDQQAINLVIAWHRRHGRKMDKVTTRYKYMDDILVKVKDSVKDRDLEEKLELISQYFGVKTLFITKFKQDTSTWLIETERGNVNISSTKQLKTLSDLQTCFIEDIDLCFPQNKKMWPKVLNAMLAVKKDIWVADEAVFPNRLRRRLVGYINFDREDRANESEATSKSNTLYKYNKFNVLLGNDGCWLISIDLFWTYYDNNFNTRNGTDTKRDIFTMLRQWGCTAGHKINLWRNTEHTRWSSRYSDDGVAIPNGKYVSSERINRSYWKIPTTVCGVDPQSGDAVDPIDGKSIYPHDDGVVE